MPTCIDILASMLLGEKRGEEHLYVSRKRLFYFLFVFQTSLPSYVFRLRLFLSLSLDAPTLLRARLSHVDCPGALIYK